MKIDARQQRWGGLAFASLMLSLAANAAPWDYPIGNSWDCLTSGGGQDGIAFLTFTTDTSSNGLYTFSGFFLNAGKKGNGGTDGRGGSTTSRDGSGSTSNVVNNLYGAGDISGNWYFDSKGRIVGSYYTVVNVSGASTNYYATNAVVPVSPGDGNTYDVLVTFTNKPTAEVVVAGVTNIVQNPNFVIAPTGTTNSVSFVGTVVPGKRLNLVASTLFGKVAFKGVPLEQTVFLDGSMWSATKTAAGFNYQEFLHLTQTTVPNVYLVDGQGPTYTYNSSDSGIGTQSFCLISKQKKIGFYIAEFPFGSTESQQRTTLGTFSNKSSGTSFKTKGAGEADLTVPVTFNGNVIIPPP